MAARKLAPALAVGCTAILKPPELTPLSSLLLAEVAREAGLPDGVFTVLTTVQAPAVSQALMSDARLRKVSFTGSTPVGKTLLAQAAQNVMRCSMELGGNAPFIVCEDADLDVAIEAAVIAKMRAGGQSCVAANRMLVHESIADEFAARLADELKTTVVGDPFGDDATLGPLVNAAAVEKASRLAEQAQSTGAVEVFSGERPPGAGHYFAPILLDHVPASAQIMHEEVFGPVAAIHRFSDDEEAIRIANDTEFGLVAYVISSDVARVTRIVERLDVGMVGINRGLVSNAAAPFGGFKSSGLGKEGGPEGLEEYTELKYFSVPKTSPLPL
jgi:succinate-semialdehyde dehydrogenase/glutarate-semialdehyde dehydrogenase